MLYLTLRPIDGFVSTCCKDASGGPTEFVTEWHVGCFRSRQSTAPGDERSNLLHIKSSSLISIWPPHGPMLPNLICYLFATRSCFIDNFHGRHVINAGVQSDFVHDQHTGFLCPEKKNQTDRDEFDVGLGKTECTAKLTRSPTAAFLEKRS